MEQADFEYLIIRLKEDFFLEAVIAIVALWILYLLILNFKKNILHILIVFYTSNLLYLFTLGSDMSLSLIFTNNIVQKKLVLETGNIIFSILESVTFYCYFKRVMLDKKSILLIKIMSYLFIMFLSYCIFMIYKSETKVQDITDMSFTLNSFEFFLFFVICIRYFYKTISVEQIEKPVELYELLLVNAIFIYSAIALPLIIIAPNTNRLPVWAYQCTTLLHYLSIINILFTILIALKKKKYIFR